VATCNSTHFFIVRDGEVWTSDGLFCLGGITRANVLRVCRESGVPVCEKRFSLVDVYGADEAFVTGTFAGLTAVHEVDGRVIGEPPDDGERTGPVTRRLRDLYKTLARREAVRPA
jgi:branched-chain amino acid aminotransferase